MRLFLLFYLILGTAGQRDRKDRNRRIQDDAISDFEEFESLEDVGNLIREIMEENLLIKRRVNRVIQENQELSERVALLEEAVDELTEMASTEVAVVQTTTEETTSTTTSSTTTTTTEAPVQIQTKFIDTSLMEENSERVAKLEEGVLIMMDQLSTHNNALEGVEGAFQARDSHMRRLREEFNQFRAQQKSILTLQRNAINQMENKYNFLERKISSTKKSSPPRSLSDTIGPVLEKVFGLARSSISNAPAAEVEMDFMPQREFTNIAKVMWQLPTSCDELQARGLSEDDSGKYLIRLENSENTIGVYCDFASGKTIFPFAEAGLEPLVINADTCGGEDNSPCLPKNVTYGFSDREIDSIQTTFGSCEQVIFMKCSSSSVSDRLSWYGSDGSLNKYFSGDSGSGCECALGETNSCSGGFLCNCDAVSEGEDEGTITNKRALPMKALRATEITSSNQLRIALGPLTCWGKPTWTNWSSWSTCDASCEGGRQIRTRSCDGDCGPGDNIQVQECNTNSCSSWLEWSSWSSCIDEDTKEQKACGIKERFRECDGSGCPGDYYEREQCNCVMVLGGNGHKLNVSLIDYENDFEQEIDLGTRVRMPALTAHCVVPFNNRIFVIGGWNTMNQVFEIRGCDIIPVRVRLEKRYRVHSCAVRDDRIWVCGSRDDPFSCESYDEDFNMKDEGYTLFPHSYAAMVHNQRGLTLLGGISPKEGRNNKVEHYQNGAWTAGPSLPERISSHSAHDVNGDIFVIGGSNADLGVMGQSPQVYMLGKDAEKWSTMPPLMRARSHHASVALPNGGIFIVGDGFTFSPVQIYRNNQTETLSVKHGARAFPAAIHLSRPMC